MGEAPMTRKGVNMSTFSINLEARPVSHASPAARASPLLRSKWDSIFIGLAVIQGTLLIFWPTPILVALGMWWGANTIAHNFIHRPFFTSRWLNRIFSFYFSLILGLPQTLWRSRHLAHHADREWKFKLTTQLLIETFGVLFLWSAIASSSPRFFFGSYIPAYFLGLCLCWF